MTISAAQEIRVGAVSLRDAWLLRNAAAETLIKAEEQFRRLLDGSSSDDIVSLLEAFSQARSPGPEWSRTFDPLIERLWTWCDAQALADAEAHFRTRGPAWAAVANALTPQRGAELKTALQRKASPARLPPFTVG